MNANTYNRIQAVENVGAIMRTVAAGGSAGVGVADVAESVKMKEGTARCYLASLEDIGYISQAGRGRYRLGMGLALFYAKTRSIKEAEIRRSCNDLGELGIKTEVTIHER